MAGGGQHGAGNPLRMQMRQETPGARLFRRGRIKARHARHKFGQQRFLVHAKLRQAPRQPPRRRRVRSVPPARFPARPSWQSRALPAAWGEGFARRAWNLSTCRPYQKCKLASYVVRSGRQKQAAEASAAHVVRAYSLSRSFSLSFSRSLRPSLRPSFSGSCAAASGGSLDTSALSTRRSSIFSTWIFSPKASTSGGGTVLGNGGHAAVDQAAQGVKFLVQRHIDVQRFVHRVQIRAAGHAPEVGLQLHDILLLQGVKLVENIADNLLQQVFHGDQTARAAVFVHDDGHMRLGFLHIAQQHVRPHGFRHEIGRGAATPAAPWARRSWC